MDSTVLKRPIGASLCLAIGLLLAFGSAKAQFDKIPTPVEREATKVDAENEFEYRIHAARHIYARYPMRVHRGKLAPLLHGVAIIDTEIDKDGQVVKVNIVRQPAAKEVAAWAAELIRRAAPFPAPVAIPDGKVVYREIWLVNAAGNFQLDTLTEGQN